MPTPPEPSSPASYSTAEVARRLGVSVPTVQRWVDSGHLKAWKTLGGHRRIEAESADRLIEAQQTRPLADSKQPLTVMVVDDNPSDRELLAALLDEALPGAQLSFASNGFQALVAIGKQAPDVLITDIVMPHMNGIEMLRELAMRSTSRPGAIVAVSSLLPAQLAKLGAWPAGVPLLAKPLEPDEFIATLRNAAVPLRRA